MVGGVAVYLGVLTVVAVACLFVAVRAWRRRDAPGARKLALVNVGNFFWTVFTIIPTYFRGDPQMWLPLRFTIPSVVVVVYFLFTFTLEYTGRSKYLTRRVYGLLAIEPILATILALTNGTHHLFWTQGPPDPSAALGFVRVFGVGFLVHAVYTYILILAAIVMLAEFALRSDFLFQRQVFAIFLAVLAPLIGNVVFVFTPLTYDLSQIGLGVTGIALGWAMLSDGFLDITPVARNRIVDTMDAAVFVTDTEDRIVDINDKGRELLMVEDEDVTGTHVSTVLDPLPSVKNVYEQLNDVTTTESFEAKIGARSFTVRVSPLYDNRDMLTGRVILVQEITDQVERQQQLRRRNEQLDRFASVVSHDLRNPLTVASGRLELLRQEYDDDDLDQIASAIDRMDDIISDMLTLTNTDGSDIEMEPLSIAAVATAAWENVLTDDALLTITSDSELVASRTLLMQLFENLFRNSVEHGSTSSRTLSDDAVEHGSTDDPNPSASPDDMEHSTDSGPHSSDSPSLRVTISDLEDGFCVEDDGVGIPAEAREDLFDEGVSGKAENTGLGLMIVDEIAALHGWSITVTESSTGGARFEFHDERPVQNFDQSVELAPGDLQ